MHFKENLITFKQAATDLSSWLLDLLFPIRCLVCGREDKEFLCLFCKSQLKTVDSQVCIMCKKPSVNGITHPGCLTPWGPDGLITLFDYHDKNVANAIIQGKYSFLPAVFKSFGSMLANAITQKYPHVAAMQPSLIPLPLHKGRKRWRGFNQAEILCKNIAEKLQLNILEALVRTKATKTQKDLKREERLKNMDSAFTLSKACQNNQSLLLDKNFILLDDVTTTGATLLEAVKVLKRNGASQVWCVTVARD